MAGKSGAESTAHDAGAAHEGAPAPGEAAPTAASLRERLQALVESWHELQSGSWNAMAALAQYEEIERISALAEEIGERAIAAPAVELTVYLCTFVEGRLYPSNAQRARLSELVARLEQVVSGGGRRQRQVAPAADERRVVLYWRAREAELIGLAAQLGQHRYVVRPCDDFEQAAQLADDTMPDALVVDHGMLPQLGELLERVERTRGEVKGRIVTLVTGAEIDNARRLFAQRAGADAVMESRDALAIATRLDELVAHQKNLNYRVLVVEDDRSQAMYCESVLKLRGIVTRVCLLPEDVLDAIVEFKPDLVLLDLYLPGMNGIEVAQLIRERPEWSFLPIVFLSGETDLDKRFDAIRMGGDDFITKPVKPRHLIVEVESRVRRARLLPAGGPDAGAIGERRGALVSRQHFIDELARAVTASEGESAALVMFGVVRDEALREDLGLVQAGVLSHQLAAALAAESDLARPVCAYGDLRWLLIARAENEALLRQRIDKLRERLQTRRWLAADNALRIDVAVGAVRVANAAETPDSLVRRVRAQLQDAVRRNDGTVAYDGGPRAPGEQADPQTRLARALLRGPMIRDAVRIEYQALVPLTGELAGQYAVRFALVAPKASNRIEVPPDRLPSLARELGLAVAADRYCVRHGLSMLSERQQRGDDLRFFFPLSIESALDPSFAPWLAAELQGRALAPSGIVLQLAAEDVMRESSRITPALDALQLVGTRLCITGLEGGEAHLRLVRTPAFSAVRLEAPPVGEGGVSTWGNERGRLVVEARKQGKLTLAHGVRDAREIADLLKLGVNYLQSPVFAPWSTDANFDFSSTKA